MNKIFLLLLFFLVFLSQGYTQPYQSLFGQQSTYWILEDFWGWSEVYLDTIPVVKDTILGTKSYKYIGGNGYFYGGGFLREDLNTGKVWYRARYTPMALNDTSELLMMDMSLQVGDTFDINYGEFSAMCYQFGLNIAVVDSIYYLGGRKIIAFNHHDCHGHPYLFIEGVGPSAGPTYKQSYEHIAGNYLLCAYKDGIQIYLNDYYGICNPHLNNAVESQWEKNKITLYPNPVEDILFLKNDEMTDLQWKIQDICGKEIAKGNIENQYNYEINLEQYPKGAYFIVLNCNNTVQTHKFVKN